MKVLPFIVALALATPANVAAACGAEDPVDCGKVDFEGASPIYSIDQSKLKKSPLEVKVAFIPDIVPYLRDRLSQRQIADGLRKYLTGLHQSLPAGSGMLLQVRVMTDDFGNSTLPVGFLLPIGAGMNPVDAYAEFINRPTITVPAADTTAHDTGHFIWIERGDGNRLDVAVIPRELTGALLRDGQTLANEKARLKALGRPDLTYRAPDYVSRAEYWQKQAAQRQAELAAAGRAEAVGKLVARFAELQAQHAQLEAQYQQAQRRSSENQALLGGAQLLLDLGGKWIEGSGSKAPPLSFDRTAALARQDLLRRDMQVLKTSIDQTTGRMKQVDDSLNSVPELKVPKPM